MQFLFDAVASCLLHLTCPVNACLLPGTGIAAARAQRSSTEQLGFIVFRLRRGRVVKGIEHVARSRYEEDVHPQNHTSVWGSFWANGTWGYACCKSTTKNSMCLGAKAEAVRLQNEAAMAQNAERAMAERAAAASAAEASGAMSKVSSYAQAQCAVCCQCAC